ncbi:lactate dehydrogenase [Mesomycoplasma ovipneumoniae]|uniref:lactate dehydrogenase n=1 Tax=Mesomycoplasma ovipneumoniae TaxID=29562 RepID=UPI0028AF00DC|nr:lactate dehydrogenase [Mesomycoplasma ovipneumoniae]MDW2924658.1 lactate dehydrogenase [Mesomycoplasma ovipneumoniae]WNM16842.1 lactate dehydrogenase [Mesomycoplasma ovipneumoniae]
MIIGLIGVTNTSINLIYNLILAKTDVDFLLIDENFIKTNQIIKELNLIIKQGGYKNKVFLEDYGSLEKANILIIDPAQNLVPGMSLVDLALENSEKIYKIGYLVRHSNFNGIAFVLGYNNSILCKIFSFASGLIGKKVFGIGPNLENMHANLFVNDLNLDIAKDNEFLVLGDHGHSFLLDSNIEKNDTTIDKISKIDDYVVQTNNETLENLIRKTPHSRVLGLILSKILLDILNKRQNFHLLNCWVESFYNIRDDFFSLPVKIDIFGQVKTKDIKLTQADREKLVKFIWEKNKLLDLTNKFLSQ